MDYIKILRKRFKHTTRSPPSKTYTSPTILIVPGAGPRAADCLKPLTSLLERSYSICTITHPQIAPGATSAAAAIQHDGDNVRATLDDLVNSRGLDVLVLTHSWGGIPAVIALSEPDEWCCAARAAAGRRGGVLAVLFVTSFLALPRSTLARMPGGPRDLSFSLLLVDLDEEAQKKGGKGGEERDGGDEMLLNSTVAESLPFGRIPCYYLFATRDASIVLAHQRRMVELANGYVERVGRAGEVVAFSCDGPHNPFTDHSASIAQYVRDIIAKPLHADPA